MQALSSCSHLNRGWRPAGGSRQSSAVGAGGFASRNSSCILSDFSIPDSATSGADIPKMQN